MFCQNCNYIYLSNHFYLIILKISVLNELSCVKHEEEWGEKYDIPIFALIYLFKGRVYK